MKCNGNHSGHSSTVLTFGIVYIILFLVDIATGAIMIIYGAWFVTAGAVTAFGTSLTNSVTTTQKSVVSSSVTCT